MTEKIDPFTIKVQEKHAGKYVALKSFLEPIIVAYGKNPHRVLAAAKKKGYDKAVLLFNGPWR
ncbi:DUF5678 domain-containing protein [Geomonas propionica]|uniref:DUF5678 domain-containing protein n=1 Tax=Geomonas propionica TaxID=2798582 RepID=A0ABS0YR85_9BACT|nr:DUF5678 domain-containing protein [Geomonas propionica]MBJ6800428.1 hypothetical protein [Geomonas propionica]